MASGSHVGAQGDLLAGCEARLEGARLFERKHEGKGFGRREAVEVPPAYEIVVVARPASALVLRIAQHPDGAVTLNGELRRSFRLCGDKHDLASHILARLMYFANACADIYQISRNHRAFAVLRQC